MKDENIHIIHQYLNGAIDIDEVKRQLSKEDFQAWKETLEEVAHLPQVDFNIAQEFEKIQLKMSGTKSTFPFLKIAAVLILLVSTSLFVLYYQGFNEGKTSVSSAMAQNEFVTLPDNSEARLNTQSSISFNKQRWDEERLVTLEGEAFFDVQEGKTFTVDTPNGTVQVLGTTFNVHARSDHFAVTCYTGKVKVIFSNVEVILKPGESIDNLGQQITQVSNTKPNWMLERSQFESVPLTAVIADIEKQKNVKIVLKVTDSVNFTGSYSHSMKADEIVELVCRSLDLRFTKLNSSTYEISEAAD